MEKLELANKLLPHNQTKIVSVYIKKTELVDDYTERFANPYIAAERGYIDDVIDPAETRRKVIAGFSVLKSKREDLPQRKHGVIPL